MGSAGALPIVGQAVGLAGGDSARKGAQKGASMAAGEYGIPGSIASGAGGRMFMQAGSPLFGAMENLFKGNGLSELEPALRAGAQNTQNQQRGFAEQLGRSGLVGSGFALGGNQAIANQGGVNRANTLAQLPGITRQNLAAAYPYFSTAMQDLLGVQSGKAGIKFPASQQNAAAKSNEYNTAGNMIGSAGMGKGGGGGKGQPSYPGGTIPYGV